MSRFILPFESVFDNNGHPLDGAKLYFFDTGTGTPKNTYSDVALTTPNTNPVIADSQGQFSDIFLESGAYRAELKDKNNVTQPGYPEDDISALVDNSSSETLDNKTFSNFKLNDTSENHQYVFGVSELSANRTVTMPLLTGDDSFVFNDFAATLKNKTFGTGTIIGLGSDADGDIYVRNSGVLARIAKGSDVEILQQGATIPAWTAKNMTDADATELTDGSTTTLHAHASAGQVGFGVRQNRTFGTTYQAAQDGIVEAWDDISSGGDLRGITDASATPTFIASRVDSPSTSTRGSVTFHVLKNEYYKVTTSGSSTGNYTFTSLGT